MKNIKNLNNDFYAVERFNAQFLYEDTVIRIPPTTGEILILNIYRTVQDIDDAVIEQMSMYQTCLRTAFNRFVKQDIVFNTNRDMENYLHAKIPSLSQAYIKEAIKEADTNLIARIELVEYHIDSLERYKIILERYKIIRRPGSLGYMFLTNLQSLVNNQNIHLHN